MKSTTKAMNLEQGTEGGDRDIKYSHRGAVLLLSDGKLMIEVEDVRHGGGAQDGHRL